MEKQFHPSTLCNDLNCTMKDSCARFVIGKAKRFYNGYKQWRGEECNFKLDKHSAEMTAEEIVEARIEESKEIRQIFGR